MFKKGPKGIFTPHINPLLIGAFFLLLYFPVLPFQLYNLLALSGPPWEEKGLKNVKAS